MANRASCEVYKDSLTRVKEDLANLKLYIKSFGETGDENSEMEIKILSKGLEMQIELGWKALDPHQVELRRKLMKRLGLKSLPNAFSQGWATVIVDDKTRMVNKDGEFFHEKFGVVYEIQREFHEGFALGWDEIDERRVYIGLDGVCIKFAMDPISHEEFSFEANSDFHEGYAEVKLKGTDETVFIDQIGYIFANRKFKKARDFHEGKAGVQLGDDTWAYLNNDGTLSPERYSKHAGDFHEGRAWVHEEKGFAMVNERGVRINNNYYLKTWLFSEGLAAAESSEGIWQFLDEDGYLAIEDLYEGIQYRGFHEGKCSVQKDGKWFYIDKNGKELFGGERFDMANAFVEGRAQIRQNGEVYFIDEKGRKIFGPYEEVYQDFFDGVAIVSFGDRQPAIEIDWYGRDVHRQE